MKIIEPEMVRVPAGTFLMGSPPDEPGRWDDEGPQFECAMSAFWLGAAPVTFAEYDLFCESTGTALPDDMGWGRKQRPVINVSWHDAVSYCRWLSGETGQRYFPPTEAQWEYACKWALSDPAVRGRDLGSLGWYRDNSEGQTHPVRHKLPGCGLYDMLGNVLEWCADDLGDYRLERQENPVGELKLRVLRGGSWCDGPWTVRAAYRCRVKPVERISDVGFRLSRM